MQPEETVPRNRKSSGLVGGRRRQLACKTGVCAVIGGGAGSGAAFRGAAVRELSYTQWSVLVLPGVFMGGSGRAHRDTQRPTTPDEQAGETDSVQCSNQRETTPQESVPRAVCMHTVHQHNVVIRLPARPSAATNLPSNRPFRSTGLPSSLPA